MQNSIYSDIVATALLGGCASRKYPVQINWEHGEKRGSVTYVFDASAPRDQLLACIASSASDQIAAGLYVRVKYHHRRHFLYEVRGLPNDTIAKVGDLVEFYAKHCRAGKLSTISRGLPSE